MSNITRLYLINYKEFHLVCDKKTSLNDCTQLLSSSTKGVKVIDNDWCKYNWFEFIMWLSDYVYRSPYLSQFRVTGQVMSLTSEEKEEIVTSVLESYGVKTQVRRFEYFIVNHEDPFKFFLNGYFRLPQTKEVLKKCNVDFAFQDLGGCTGVGPLYFKLLVLYAKISYDELKNTKPDSSLWQGKFDENRLGEMILNCLKEVSTWPIDGQYALLDYTMN